MSGQDPAPDGGMVAAVLKLTDLAARVERVEHSATQRIGDAQLLVVPAGIQPHKEGEQSLADVQSDLIASGVRYRSRTSSTTRW